MMVLLLVLSLPMASAAAMPPLQPASAVPMTPLTAAEVLALPDGVVARYETPHTTIQVGKADSYLSLAFRENEKESMQTIINVAKPRELVGGYAREMARALRLPPKLERVVVIGLGGGSLSSYMARHLPDVPVTVLELDPVVIATAKAYFGVPARDTVRILEGDGRLLLKDQEPGISLIAIDAFRGDTVPFHMITKEFMQLAYDKLAPGGVLTWNINPQNALAKATVVTLGSVFDEVRVSTTFTNFIATAVKGGWPTEAEEIDRVMARQTRYDFTHPLQDTAAIEMGTVERTEKGVLTDDHAPAAVLATQPPAGSLPLSDQP